MSQSDIPQTIVDFFEQSQVPLTLSNPQLPDDPLVLANDAFYRMTGYNSEDILGKNCRFLQGKKTKQPSVQTLRADFIANRDSKVLLTNYRKSGEEFDNFLFVFTISDAKGKPMFRIGSQFEIPEINRNTAFKSHTTTLRDGIDRLNKESDIARQQLINTGDLIGVSIKSLLMARLEDLKI